MPYVSHEVRVQIAEGHVPIKPGELNYAMSQLIKGYIAMNGKSYTTLNAVAGVLSCLNMEVYRRITARYEDEKLIENGEVF